jgi:hypothetical protein
MQITTYLKAFNCLNQMSKYHIFILLGCREIKLYIYYVFIMLKYNKNLIIHAIGIAFKRNCKEKYDL